MHGPARADLVDLGIAEARLERPKGLNDMTLSLAIILNVLLDLAILSLLAFAMSRAAKLTPHRPALSSAPAETAHRPSERARRRRLPVQLHPAIDR